jgi:hypothetical protein
VSGALPLMVEPLSPAYPLLQLLRNNSKKRLDRFRQLKSHKRQYLMTTITHDLAKILSTIRRHGDFYAAGTSDCPMPSLEIGGVGRISLPLLPLQAEQLIAISARSPFGRGKETLIDTDVRRTWQIQAEQVHLSGRGWGNTLDTIVARAAAGLGVTEAVSAELYKLLIYDPGSFFVEHRDTEKSAGMFATLVLVLPSVCSGGELIIRHRGREVCLDLNCSEPADAAFAAFYADCVHEVRPVTSGYRLALVYNLARKGNAPAPAFPDYEKESAAIAAMLRRWIENKNRPDDGSPEKLIYPLEHAYTPAEIAFDKLKNADAAVAAVLVAAAAAQDCDLHLALVSIDESGSAEYSGYAPRGRGRWHRGYDDDDDDDAESFEMGEIFERTLTVSDWRSPDGTQAAINALPFVEAELCPPDAFEEEEPDEQHFHEATGNAGASFERTYRRAALVLWPRTRKLAVLNQAGLAVTLPYLSDLANRWKQGGEGKASGLWCDAHTLSGYILAQWPASNRYPGTVQTGNATSLLSSLAQLEDTGCIDAFLATVAVIGAYSGGENEALVRAAGLLPPDRAAVRIEQIIAGHAYMMPGACANLLSRVSADAGFAGTPALLYPAATVLAETLLGERVGITPPEPWRRPTPIEPALIVDLLTALGRIDAAPLAGRVVHHVLANPDVFGMDAILVPAVLDLTQHAQDIASVRRLRTACLRHLRARISENLAPAAGLARPCAIACRCAYCAELSRFLADAVRREWALKAAAQHRGHVESSIRQSGCDVDVTTSTRGRPYSLIATKNQASYERRVVQRKKDLADLARLDVAQ